MKQHKNKQVHDNEHGNTTGQKHDKDIDQGMTKEGTIGSETISVDKSTEELLEVQKKYDEVNDKYLRLYSEFDNYRKRAIKERIELSKTASEHVISDFLVILDDFERAISSFENVTTVEPLKEGTLLIYNKFRNNLNQKGLEVIEALGQTFDTDYHEAIANVPAPSEDQKNKVIDVTQKGYTLNGKVIRFAKVVVGN